jgi:predicted amidohydrolase YtcJ
MRVALLAGLCCVLAPCVGALAQSPADVVVTNGKVLTVDAAFSVAQAVANDAGRIVAVGTSAVVRRYGGAGPELCAGDGAAVVPGVCG